MEQMSYLLLYIALVKVIMYGCMATLYEEKLALVTVFLVLAILSYPAAMICYFQNRVGLAIFESSLGTGYLVGMFWAWASN